MKRIWVVLALVLAACGGGEATDTTTADPGAATTTAGGGATTAAATPDATTTTVGDSGEDDDGGTVSFEDVPAECVAAFVDYLQQIEPIVEGLDFESLTLEEFGALAESPELTEASTDFEATQSANCSDIDLEVEEDESWQQMLALARDEAPGTVGYLEYLRTFVTSFGEGSSGATSGDCETDIAALMEWVNSGTSFQDLSAAEGAQVAALLGAIQTECSVERAGEVFSTAEVQSFLSG